MGAIVDELSIHCNASITVYDSYERQDKKPTINTFGKLFYHLGDTLCPKCVSDLRVLLNI